MYNALGNGLQQLADRILPWVSKAESESGGIEEEDHFERKDMAQVDSRRHSERFGKVTIENLAESVVSGVSRLSLGNGISKRSSMRSILSKKSSISANIGPQQQRPELLHEPTETKRVKTELVAPVKPPLSRRISLRLRKLRQNDTGKQRKHDTFAMSELARNPRGSITALQLPDAVRRIVEIVVLVESDDLSNQIEGTRKIRRLLSTQNPPIDAVIETGVVPRFIEFLSMEDAPMLQFEAAWCITNLCSGNSSQCQAVVQCGCVVPLIELLTSMNEEVRSQAVWAIGNIAGDGVAMRDMLLRENVMQPILLNLHPTMRMQHLQFAVWVVSNLCRGSPPPNFQLVSAALPPLAGILHLDDSEILTDACWALYYLSQGEHHEAEEVFRAGVLPHLVRIGKEYSSSSQVLITPVLRTLGNLVTGTDEQTQEVIDSKALDVFLKYYMQERFCRDCMWAFSNIAAGTQQQIQTLFNTGIIPTLVQFMKPGSNVFKPFRIQQEVCFIFSNAAKGGSSSQVGFLVENHCVEVLCSYIETSWERGMGNHLTDLAHTGVHALHMILVRGKGQDQVTSRCLNLLVDSSLEDEDVSSILEILADRIQTVN